MPIQSSDLTPEYGWNSDAQRYINLSTGQFVSAAQVRTALDQAILSAKDGLRDVSQALLDGQISLADWQTQMAQQIKLIHCASASAAAGGWAQMTPADWGRVGQQLRQQYAYLQRFALQIESGAQALNGSLITRALMYGEAGRGTYEDFRRAEAQRRGMTHERRRLGAAEHCEDCVRYAGWGWRPIGTLPRIGQSRCRTNCKCAFEFRKAEALGPEYGGFGL